MVRLFPLPPRVILPAGTRLEFNEVAVTTRLLPAVSRSVMVNGIGPVEVSSLTVRSGMWEMMGGSLMGRTVTVKLRAMILLLAPPSLAITVRVADPVASGTALKVSRPDDSGL